MASKSDEIKKLEATAAAYEKSLSAASDAWANISKIVNKSATDQAALNNAEKEYNNLLRAQEATQSRINKLQDKNFNTAESLVESLNERMKLLMKEGKHTSKSKKDNNEILKTFRLQKSLTKDLNDLSDDQLRDLLRENNLREEMSDKVKTLNSRVREQQEIIDAANKSANDFLGDVSKGIAKLPIVGESLSKGFDAFVNSEYANKLKTKLAKLMFDPKTVGKSFKGALGLGMAAAGAGLISAGIKAGMAREQELKDQQRSIGLTNEQSKAVDKMQLDLLYSSNSMVVSLEEARKATAELVDDFGFIGASNSEMVDQQVKLTKAYGLQAEEATNLQKAAKINGQSTEEMKIDILATAEGFNKAKGSSYSLSSVMKTVSKLSDSVRLQFRGSNTELTSAVMKAKALGTSLEDLNGIADQLLNIESSIEAQVTAQIVTGKNINMEKARMFALMDDMPGLMDELVKQEIDYNSYSKMNRIEKQSTAAALGMNTDQMAKFVSQQELSKQLGIDMADTQNQTAAGLENSLKSRQEEISQLAKSGNMAAQQYEKDNEALTTQEKMTAAVEQMNRLFQMMAPIVVGIGVALTVAGIAAMMMMGSLTLGVATVAGIIAGVAAKSLMSSAMPSMAEGGFIPYSPGGTQVTMAEESGPKGEVIVPLKKYDNMVLDSNGMSQNSKQMQQAPPIVNNNVSLVIDGKSMDAIVQASNRINNSRAGVGNFTGGIPS
jgi:hypothetical protein